MVSSPVGRLMLESEKGSCFSIMAFGKRDIALSKMNPG